MGLKVCPVTLSSLGCLGRLFIFFRVVSKIEDKIEVNRLINSKKNHILRLSHVDLGIIITSVRLGGVDMERYLNSVVKSYFSHKDFNATNLGQNFIRIFVVGGIYTMFEIVGLILSSFGVFSSDIRLYVMAVVVFHLIYLPFMAVVYRKKLFKSEKVYEILTNIYYIVVLLWASFFTALVYLADGDITIYSIVLFLISAVFIITPNTASLLYITNFVVFSGMVYSIVSEIGMANGIVFKALIVTVLALVISHSNYLARRSLFESNRKLEQANKTLNEKSQRDSLTHLYNNEYIFDKLKSKIEGVKNSNQKLSVIMIDIDNFKFINDSFGHLYGDHVIKSVAEVIQSAIRDDDVLGRYGGEEFIVILTDTCKEIAVSVAERVRSAVEAIDFDKAHRITVSIGVSEYGGEDPKNLINSADINLYKAKFAGKNKVVA